MIRLARAVTAVAAAVALTAAPPVYALGPLEKNHPAVQRGMDAYANGRCEEALAAFDQAARELPRSPAVEFNRGNALYKLGRTGEAKAAWERVLTLEPGELQARTHYNLGTLNAKAGKDDEAISAFRKALRANPRDDDARHNLEALLRKKKQQQQEQPPDAGQPDAGPDGGSPPDAGQPDGGTPDAGPDGGRPDGGEDGGQDGGQGPQPDGQDAGADGGSDGGADGGADGGQDGGSSKGNGSREGDAGQPDAGSEDGGQRSERPERGDGGTDAGTASQAEIGAQTQALHHAGAKALNQNIGGIEHAQDRLHTLGHAQVQIQGRTTARCDVVWTQSGGAAGSLDTHHLRAHVGKQHGTKRRRPQARHFNDFESF